jgi:hypothetical protein
MTGTEPSREVVVAVTLFTYGCLPPPAILELAHNVPLMCYGQCHLTLLWHRSNLHVLLFL